MENFIFFLEFLGDLFYRIGEGVCTILWILWKALPYAAVLAVLFAVIAFAEGI